MAKNRDSMGRFIKGGGQATTMLGRLRVTGLGTFLSLSRSMKTLQSGFAKLKSGILSATLAFAPFTIAAVKGAKTFIDFEQQMQNVRAVSDLSTDQFARLTLKAKELGATTKFTGTQAGEAFELMSRQGFDFEQQMEAVSGVLALAAADGIELADSARIAGDTLKAFNLDASEMGNVADILAKTSATASTDVLQLGEAMKQAAPLAKFMKVPLSDTAAALGLIADAGIKGSAGGTAFKNMLVKLAKPTSKAKKLIGEFGLQIFKTDTGALALNKTMRSFIEGTKQITDARKRAGVLAEIFGLRSIAAVGALETAIASGKFDELPQLLRDAGGAAQEMADIRMDSFTGQMTLLGSAVSLIQTEFFGPLVDTTGDLLKSDILPFLQGLGSALLALGSGSEEQMAKFEKVPKAIQDVARGMMDAIELIKSGFESIVAQIREWSAAIGASFGPTTVRDIVKFATTFAIVGAALTPVLVTVIGIGFAISALVSIVKGVVFILSGAFLPVVIILGALGLLFITLREENESFGDVALRVWQAISETATDLWDNVLKPLWQGISQAATEVLPLLQETWLTSFGIIKEAIIDLFDVMGLSILAGEKDWVGIGETIVRVIAAAIETVVKVVTVAIVLFVSLVNAVKQVGLIIIDFLVTPFQMVGDLLGGLIAGFAQLIGAGTERNIIGGLKTIGMAIWNFLLEPMRLVLRTIIRLADAIPGLGDIVGQGLRDFANETAILTVDDATPTTTGTRGAPVVAIASGIGGSRARGGETTTGRGTNIGSIAGAEAASLAAVRNRPSFSGSFRAKESLNALALRDAANADVLKEGAIAAGKAAGKATGDKLGKAFSKAPCIDNNLSVSMDGETIARGQARHEAELKQRTGFTVTPWQRKTAAEFGAAPIRGGAG